jgi:hypothetical protein
MYKFFLRVVFFIALVMMTVLAKPDSLKEKPQMADQLRSTGKFMWS